MGNIPAQKQTRQSRKGLASLRLSQSLLLEEPEHQQSSTDAYLRTEQGYLGRDHIERLGSPKLQKQSYSLEQYPLSPSLLHPSPSTGSIPVYRLRLQTRGGLNAFPSPHSLLLEEHEFQEPNRSPPIETQNALASGGGSIERLGTPKLLKKCYSMEQYPTSVSLIRPSSSVGSILGHKQGDKSRGGLHVLRPSQSLLLEEPEVQQADKYQSNFITELNAGNSNYYVRNNLQ